MTKCNHKKLIFIHVLGSTGQGATIVIFYCDECMQFFKKEMPQLKGIESL